jgi:hypothetical protein
MITIKSLIYSSGKFTKSVFPEKRKNNQALSNNIAEYDNFYHQNTNEKQEY